MQFEIYSNFYDISLNYRSFQYVWACLCHHLTVMYAFNNVECHFLYFHGIIVPFSYIFVLILFPSLLMIYSNSVYVDVSYLFQMSHHYLRDLTSNLQSVQERYECPGQLPRQRQQEICRPKRITLQGITFISSCHVC